MLRAIYKSDLSGWDACFARCMEASGMSATLRIVDRLWSRCGMLMETGQTGQAASLLQRLLHLELPQTLRAEATLMLAELLRSNGEYRAARRHISVALAGDTSD